MACRSPVGPRPRLIELDGSGLARGQGAASLAGGRAASCLPGMARGAAPCLGVPAQVGNRSAALAAVLLSCFVRGPIRIRACRRGRQGWRRPSPQRRKCRRPAPPCRPPERPVSGRLDDVQKVCTGPDGTDGVSEVSSRVRGTRWSQLPGGIGARVRNPIHQRPSVKTEVTCGQAIGLHVLALWPLQDRLSLPHIRRE